MKKAMVYVIALSLALSVMLTGCGMDGRPTAPTATPKQTILPETMMPDLKDGVVNDNDGIIEDRDNGSGTGVIPEQTVRPDSGTKTGMDPAAKR